MNLVVRFADSNRRANPSGSDFKWPHYHPPTPAMQACIVSELWDMERLFDEVMA